MYSPDIDIYNIRLTFVDPSKEVIVQLNIPHSLTTIYLNINELVSALKLDPDLASLQRHQLPEIFQVLYICSGCDYISYFAGHGKPLFFNHFFQHANFINGKEMTGSLSDIDESVNEVGFLAFIRLIGTVYFKKYYSAIASLKGVYTPQQLYHCFPNHSIKEQHLQWYNEIRLIVSDRITNEEERMPTHTSMWRHWLRSCWVAKMWQNSWSGDIMHNIPNPTESGWKKHEDEIVYDWECPEMERKVKETIDFLLKGCSCKKGCATLRCKCKKNGNPCGPGCTCIGCKNVLLQVESDEESEEGSDCDESEESCNEEENILTEVISEPINDHIIYMH